MRNGRHDKAAHHTTRGNVHHEVTSDSKTNKIKRSNPFHLRRQTALPPPQTAARERRELHTCGGEQLVTRTLHCCVGLHGVRVHELLGATVRSPAHARLKFRTHCSKSQAKFSISARTSILHAKWDEACTVILGRLFLMMRTCSADSE